MGLSLESFLSAVELGVCSKTKIPVSSEQPTLVGTNSPDDATLRPISCCTTHSVASSIGFVVNSRGAVLDGEAERR